MHTGENAHMKPAMSSSLALGCNYGYKALDNGVGRLPVLGYNTWNAYQCNINEDLLLETAQLMKSLGLQVHSIMIDKSVMNILTYSLGRWIQLCNIDDCYAEKNRSAVAISSQVTSPGLLLPSDVAANPRIAADTVRFKSGMKTLTDKIHALGFKTGIYSDSGWFTCGGYPGSYSNELRDLKTFNDWGFDYLKYDNCAIPYDAITREGIIGRYKRMADAVEEFTSLPAALRFCCPSANGDGARSGFGESCLDRAGEPLAISRLFGTLCEYHQLQLLPHTSNRFNGRNDLDMLQLGNGNLTFDESKSHFTAWALMKSPLFIGTNLSAITNETLSILKNKEILAINQDPIVGTSISPFRWGLNPDWTSDSNFPAQYWSGPTQDGTVFMLLNTLNEPSTLFFNLTESPWIRAGRQYSVRDLWTHTDNGTAVRNFTAPDVPAHGVVALLLKDAGNEPDGLYPKCSVWWQCTDKNGTRVGG
ncbi:glycoside hydrolase superfamily [Mucidula mucida]|nr:glycoside hydrolase superfamily [Mucidula mucida]